MNAQLSVVSMDLATPLVSEPALEVGDDSEKFSMVIALIAKY